MPKISALPTYVNTDLTTADFIPFVDSTGPTTGKMTVDNFRKGLFAGVGMTATPLDLVTTIHATGAVTFDSTLLVTGVATFTAIPVFSGGFTVTTGTSVITAGGLRVTVGGIGVGGAPNAAYGILTASTALTGTSQWGIVDQTIFSSAATTAGYGLYINSTTAAAVFTQTNNYGIYIVNTTKGAGSTITNKYGIYVEAPTGAATINYGIYVAGGTPAIYVAAGGIVVNAGNIAINTLVDPGVGYYIAGTGALITSASQYNGYFGASFSSAATTAGYGLYVKATTAAAAFTQTNEYGIFIAGTTSAPKGAGSTITNRYGLYVETVSDGGTLNYGVYVAGGTPAIYAAAGGIRTDTQGFSVGTSPQNYAMILMNTLITGSTSNSAYGIALNPVTFPSTATTAGYGIYIDSTTSAAAFTQTNQYGMYIAATAKGAGSTITNRYGLYVVGPSDGATINVSAALHATIAVPATAGAVAAGLPIMIYSNLLGIEATTNAPTHTRAKGSICININGSTTATRLYINTDGAGTWTNFVTAA